MSGHDDNDKLLDHEYDGIQELDNDLPLWWLWTFYGAIIFSFIYWLHYSFTGDGPSLDEELQASMSRIEMQRKAPTEVAGDSGPSKEELLQMGASLYKTNCASCHKADGGGSIGPNLTDEFWIHGADVASITKVIKKGVLDKGMPPWEAILRPQQVETVVAFVTSLKNTNVAGGKAAQGEKVE